LLGLKVNCFLYPLAVGGLDYFVTLSNMVYLLHFHSADELEVKEVNMNSTGILFRD